MIEGPIVCDVAGFELTEVERARIANPLVGCVILFTRNYRDPEQLRSLCSQIHAVKPSVLIGVDHEGGRVQRFREGFTAIPAMRLYGRAYEKAPQEARRALQAASFVLAAELREAGVDFTFAPVIDLDWQQSTIIGERALAASPESVVSLARCVFAGFAEAGMANCGKHFPGHGFAQADSHVSLPVDARPLETILAADAQPYEELAREMRSVMSAHVLYPALDTVPATFSRKIMTGLLRERFGFEGLLFSDDLSMGGAKVEGGILERAHKALQAGCDALIVCNDPASVDVLLEGLVWEASDQFSRHAARFEPSPVPWQIGTLAQFARYREARSLMQPPLERV